MATLTTNRTGVRLHQLPSGLIRVTRESGHVLGYVESREIAGTSRFASKRMRPGAAGFVDVGLFWSREDAVDSLVFS